MKKLLLLPILLLSLISTPCLSETIVDLVERDGIYYKKFTETPFTGKIIGREQGRIKNGKRDGAWVKYHDNGQLNNQGSYKNGEKGGDWVWYHDNGQLEVKGSYKNGKEEGDWVWYNDNGQLEEKGSWRNGEPEGEWVYSD